MTFAKNIGKNVITNISKTWVVNTAKSSLIILNDMLQMRLKLLQKKELKKATEGTGDLIGIKIADRITKVPNASQQNNSEIVTNEHDK